MKTFQFKEFEVGYTKHSKKCTSPTPPRHVYVVIYITQSVSKNMLRCHCLFLKCSVSLRIPLKGLALYLISMQNKSINQKYS